MVVEDHDPLSRRARLDQANGIIGRLDGLAFRATATRPIRIDLDPGQPQMDDRANVA